MHPLLKHPERFVWDFWYHYDYKERLFHLLFLNADPSLVPDNRHHFSARIGYATTRDFTDVEWIDDDVFHAEEGRWDNTSIWTGDVIETHDGFLFYYTSREKEMHDGLTQNIGLATSKDLIDWERIEGFRLQPDARYYEPRTVEDDTTIHAWRDPFLFRYGGESYMVVSAKSKKHPPGRKGAVALLRASDNSLTEWNALPPVYSPGWYSECEVPQVYLQGGQFVLVFSSWAKHDLRPDANNEGGLQAVEMANDRGIELGFTERPKVLLPEKSGLYASRVIPELGGDIVGFDIKKGGLRRVKAKTGYQSTDRDFSDLKLDR